MSKELWSTANIITGFAVLQPLGIAVALGKDLKGILETTPWFKAEISCIAIVFAAAYYLAVHRCWILARPLDMEHYDIWRQMTNGRMLGIWMFTGVLVFGLFARIFLGK